MVGIWSLVWSNHSLQKGALLRNKISIMLGRNAHETVEADDNFEYPGMAKESSVVIFVYSISLIWSKRKKRTH